MFIFNRYILGFLFAIGLIILILVLLFSGSPTVPKSTAPALISYANSDSATELYIYGPIVASENHSEAEVIINQEYASLTLYQGYDHSVVFNKTYNNSYNGYKAFLAALNYGGFNKGVPNSQKISSLGYCAGGDIYTFRLLNNDRQVFSYWETTCQSNPKTFDGSFNYDAGLFGDQIPNFDNLLANANL